MSKTVSKFILAAGIFCLVIMLFALLAIATNGEGWTFADKLKYIAEVTSNLFICLGVVFAIIQLFLMKKGFKADHERRKKQATIKFYNSIQKEYEESLKQIDTKFPNGEVINVHDIEKDKDLLNAIRKYLSCMERLSIGIDTGVYDIAVFEKISGVYTTRWFDRLKEAILYMRKNFHNPIAHKGFEKLVFRLRILREKRFPVQDIDFAKMKHNFEEEDL